MTIKEIKNLGWLNSWGDIPQEVENCKHDRIIINDSDRCISTVICEECGYRYQVDCS